MIMKNLIYLFLLVTLAFSGCDRVFENDVLSETPPELHVIVDDSDNEKVQGADVTLFGNQEDYDNKANALISKTTDQDGKAVFTKTELAEPGIFFVHVEKDGITNEHTSVQTKYLLLNDGHTLFFTKIE